MFDSVYTSLATAVTAEAPKLIVAFATIIGTIMGVGIAVKIYRRLMAAASGDDYSDDDYDDGSRTDENGRRYYGEDGDGRKHY